MIRATILDETKNLFFVRETESDVMRWVSKDQTKVDSLPALFGGSCTVDDSLEPLPEKAAEVFYCYKCCVKVVNTTGYCPVHPTTPGWYN